MSFFFLDSGLCLAHIKPCQAKSLCLLDWTVSKYQFSSEMASPGLVFVESVCSFDKGNIQQVIIKYQNIRQLSLILCLSYIMLCLHLLSKCHISTGSCAMITHDNCYIASQLPTFDTHKIINAECDFQTEGVGKSSTVKHLQLSKAAHSALHGLGLNKWFKDTSTTHRIGKKHVLALYNLFS